MPLTLFIRLPGGKLLLPHLGLHSVGLLLQLLRWGNPRPFGGKRLEQQVEAQCYPLSRRSMQCSLLDKELPVIWVERSIRPGPQNPQLRPSRQREQAG